MSDIAADWRQETHDAIRTIQKAMFIINMNLHKPATQARKAAVSKAVYDLQVAADVMGADYP